MYGIDDLKNKIEFITMVGCFIRTNIGQLKGNGCPLQYKKQNKNF